MLPLAYLLVERPVLAPPPGYGPMVNTASPMVAKEHPREFFRGELSWQLRGATLGTVAVNHLGLVLVSHPLVAWRPKGGR